MGLGSSTAAGVSRSGAGRFVRGRAAAVRPRVAATANATVEATTTANVCDGLEQGVDSEADAASCQGPEVEACGVPSFSDVPDEGRVRSLRRLRKGLFIGLEELESHADLTLALERPPPMLELDSSQELTSQMTSLTTKPPASQSDLMVSSTPQAAGRGAPFSEYRLRFLNFNMANSSCYSTLGELQGPGGRGLLDEALVEPFEDGGDVDITFITLVETRLNVTDWAQDYLLRKGMDTRMDNILLQNARREGSQNTRSKVRSIMEHMAASYNGNLKSLLAFSGKAFEEDRRAALFGRLTEATVAGLPVPNPKKAFMGRSVVPREEARSKPLGQNACGDAEGGAGPVLTGCAADVRLCFVGAHFPIAKLAAALEDTAKDPLRNSKVAIAQTLRKVLRKASRRGVADDHTAIFVQGDLNSRTVLHGSEARDVLLEVLGDRHLQESIQHGLKLPAGRWRELAPHDCVADLPVTYKFLTDVGMEHAMKRLTLGDVIPSRYDVGRGKRKNWSGGSDGPGKGCGPKSGKKLYKRTLTDLGEERLTSWGVVFKKNDFRAFRFPACADRVIYWAADSLDERMSWELPRGGYEVNHGQLGSDHRPVALEVVLRVSDSTTIPRRAVSKGSLHSDSISDASSPLRHVLQADLEDDSDTDLINPGSQDDSGLGEAKLLTPTSPDMWSRANRIHTI